MKLKIGAKLIIGFMSVAAIVAFVGIYASVSLRYLDDRDTLLYEGGVVPMEYLSHLGEYYHRIRVYMHKIVLSKSDGEIKEYLDIIDDFKVENDKLLKLYKDSLFTDEGKIVFDKFEKQFLIYRRDLINKFIEQIKSGNIEAAERLIMVDGLPVALKTQEEMDALLNNKISATKTLAEENTKIADRTIIIMITIIIFGVVLAVLIGVFLTQSIKNPLARVTAIAKKLAAGDLTEDLSSESDLKIKRRSDEIGELVKGIDEVITNLKTLISEVQRTSNGIYSGANQVSSSAQSLSQSATELASSIEEMSSSIEEMESTIDQNAENSQQGEKIASKSANDAKDGGNAVDKTVQSMKKIAETIQIITEIANNTNMLALNAAIEAARAGEHGEGFAVVATEVRKLAERSLKSAEEIKSIANSSVDIAEKAGRLINDVVPGIVKTADMVQEITSASKEQKSGMRQISQASQQQEKVTQLVSANSEELAAAAEEMTSQAQGLLELVNRFKLNDVGGLLEYKKERRQTNTNNMNRNFTTKQNLHTNKIQKNPPKQINKPGTNNGKFSIEHSRYNQGNNDIMLDDNMDDVGDTDDFIQL